MAAQKKKTSSAKIFWIGFAIIIVIGFVVLFPSLNNSQNTTDTAVEYIPFDFDNERVLLNNEELIFEDGAYSTPDKSHTAQMTTRYSNPSGTKAVAILTDSPEGSGTFYYLVGASLQNGQAVYDAPILLGDRVQVDSVTVTDDSVTVNYLDRPANAPLAENPTETMTATYTFQSDGSLKAN